MMLGSRVDVGRFGGPIRNSVLGLDKDDIGIKDSSKKYKSTLSLSLFGGVGCHLGAYRLRI